MGEQISPETSCESLAEMSFGKVIAAMSKIIPIIRAGTHDFSSSISAKFALRPIKFPLRFKFKFSSFFSPVKK